MNGESFIGLSYVEVEKFNFWKVYIFNQKMEENYY